MEPVHWRKIDVPLRVGVNLADEVPVDRFAKVKKRTHRAY